jgi:hypothetical protein
VEVIMKRFVLVLLAAALIWVVADRHAHRPARVDLNPLSTHKHAAVRPLDEKLREASRAHRAAIEAREEARQTIQEARVEIRESLAEAKEELQAAFHEVADELREAVDDIPVPVLPGTRVVMALPELPTPPVAASSPTHPTSAPHPIPPPHTQPTPHPQPTPPPAAHTRETLLLPGLISATQERATNEARKKLDWEVVEWLEKAGVPRSWTPPAQLVDSMILQTTVKPVVKDYGTLYEAHLLLDVSAEKRSQFTESYKRQLLQRRMVLLGGALGFVLVCLAAISGYIRADEVTRGYYTNRLRLLAAGGVGAAGVAIYHALT